MAKIYDNLFELIIDIAKEAKAKEKGKDEIFYYTDPIKSLIGWSCSCITNSNYDDVLMIKVLHVKKTFYSSLIGPSAPVRKIFHDLIITSDGRKEITEFISILSQCSEININSIERIFKMKIFW